MGFYLAHPIYLKGTHLMRFRTLALGITAVGLLAVGTAAPSPAAEVKKYEGTIATPAPVVSNMTAGSYLTDAARLTCPDPGDGDGVFYKFFDLKGDYTHFFVSGPTPVINQPEPTGVYGGTFHDYDLDLYVFDAKCNELEGEGSINTQNGIGNLVVGGKKPARFAAIAYYSGPPELPVVLEASTEKINK